MVVVADQAAPKQVLFGAPERMKVGQQGELTRRVNSGTWAIDENRIPNSRVLGGLLNTIRAS